METSGKKVVTLAIGLIQQVLDGAIAERADFDARVASLDICQGSVASIVVHQAGHYLDDADLRSVDVEYEAALRNELLYLIQKM